MFLVSPYQNKEVLINERLSQPALLYIVNKYAFLQKETKYLLSISLPVRMCYIIHFRELFNFMHVRFLSVDKTKNPWNINGILLARITIVSTQFTGNRILLYMIEEHSFTWRVKNSNKAHKKNESFYFVIIFNMATSYPHPKIL